MRQGKKWASLSAWIGCRLFLSHQYTNTNISYIPNNTEELAVHKPTATSVTRISLNVNQSHLAIILIPFKVFLRDSMCLRLICHLHFHLLWVYLNSLSQSLQSTSVYIALTHWLKSCSSNGGILEKSAMQVQSLLTGKAFVCFTGWWSDR